MTRSGSTMPNQVYELWNFAIVLSPKMRIRLGIDRIRFGIDQIRFGNDRIRFGIDQIRFGIDRIRKSYSREKNKPVSGSNIRENWITGLTYIKYVLGAPEITAKLYCYCEHLYWEGCVICSIYLR